MSPIRPLARAGLVALAALSLSACITVFPKTKDAQLYRFDGSATIAGPAEASASASASRIGVVRVRGAFNNAAAADRIMTVGGNRVSYLANARWAEPAVTMFDEAVTRAFSKANGPVRLAARGEPGRAPYALRLDVERFEAVYDRGEKAAPDVRIEVRLTLVRAADRVVAKDMLIATHSRATDNRVAAIVQAFDSATSAAVERVVAETTQGAMPVTD